MEKLCVLMVLAVLAGVGSGRASAQVAPGEVVEYHDTSLTACPEPNQVLGYFYYYWDLYFDPGLPPGDRPPKRAGSWCGAAQAAVDAANIEDPARARIPYLVEECTAGQNWRYSINCGPGTGCIGPGRFQSPPHRFITMLCVVPETPNNPPLGCVTGSGGFSRCIADRGVLPSTTPPGTPVGGGLTPNAGPPGDDSHAEVPPQMLPDTIGSQRSCTRAEAVGNPVFAGTGNKYQEELDYSTPSGLRLVRYYNSALPGWTHSYGMRVLTRDDRAVALRPTGRAHAFTGAGPGEWRGDSAARGQLIRLASDPSGSTWQYLVPDGSAEYYDAEGRLMRIVRRGGQTFMAQHEQGLLRSVTDPFGRRLLFDYDTDNRLTGVTTPEGTYIDYFYNYLGKLASASYPDSTFRVYHYENASYPLALTHAAGGGSDARWSYDAQGRAVLSEHAGGTKRHQLEFAADGSVRITDPLGTARVQRYGAAGARQVFSGQSLPCADCVGDAADRIVDGSSGLVLESRDHLGVATVFAYDTRKLLTSVTQAQGRPEQRQLQLEWHPTLRLPIRVIEPGRTTEYSYDGLGNTLAETVLDAQSGQQRAWRWTYNAQGLAETMTDPRGGLWRYGHDAQGNRISVIDPAGQETRYSFDAAGNVLTQSSPARALRSYAWNARHRLTSESEGGETTLYVYNFAGQVASVEQPSGYRIQYDYDLAGRLVHAYDSRGASIHYTLDAAGHRVREEVRGGSGQLALVTGRVINALGRVAELQGALGQRTALAYDGNGEPISITDPLNHTTRRALDGLRRVMSTTFADNAATGHAWNALDQMTQLTDPKGAATRFHYNAFGDVISETSPDIGTVQHRRNAVGDVIGTEDAKGQATTIERDQMGRPREIRRADGETVLLQYNAAGDVVRMEDRSGSTAFERDGHGRVTSKAQSVNDNPDSPSRFSVTYNHGQGKLTSVGYPSGLQVQYQRIHGRIIGIAVQAPGQQAQPFVWQLLHTALGQPMSWSWHSGDEASRFFDTDGRMTRNEFAEYVHDAAGRMTGISQTLWVRDANARFTPTTLSWLVGYDSRDRVIRFERAGASTRYTHDPNGNRLTAEKSVTSVIDLEGEFDGNGFTRTTRQVLSDDPASNRLLGLTQTTELTRYGRSVSTAGATVTYALDANGSLTDDGLRQYEYDAANRLSRVRSGHNYEAVTVRYLHNGAGQRVFRSEPGGEPGIPSAETLGDGFVAWLKRRFGWLFTTAQVEASVGTAYIFGDGELPPWALLGEYDTGSARGKGRTEYIWLPLEDGSAIPVGFYRNGKLYAVHTDHLGTPRLVTDEERRPVWQWPYSAFGDNKTTGPLVARSPSPGEPAQLKATEPIDFSLRFPGQAEDAEAGLSNNILRWYNARDGRFTQADPTGLQDGPNRFAYVNGDPLSFIDPYGLMGSRGNAAAHNYAPGSAQAAGAALDFYRNYSDMRDAWWKGADKYFHCKANCQASQRGPGGSAMACTISETREWWDQNVKRYPASDNASDQIANEYGRDQGTSNPKGSCELMCAPFRPYGLPSTY
ncbi:RHS repeat-associated core domain-containing protein [Ramlibacter sp. Leaf400]|uniref:RHS repeat-associated core domain-containing protein n=1 Tax=Ramlibacter sp. Leaf400 TaxID=1736365 RepID=UPI0006F4AE3A|nr:RHS repeat-associated core domain-containing protein [Ramlibacter sp. Leaf400]KQT08113.1 hypothetical protein ASG30_16940 [Ramlibacter sp. Leaf400]